MKLFTQRKRLEEYRIMSVEKLYFKHQMINSLPDLKCACHHGIDINCLSCSLWP